MNPRARHCIQINLQKHFGGGEVYTGFLTRALLAAGWEVTLIRNRDADFWRVVDLGHARQIGVSTGAELLDHLPADPALVLYHGPPSRKLAIPAPHKIAAIAHMPVYDRNADGFQVADKVFGVSRHVLDSLTAKGIEHAHPEPLLGVADLRDADATSAEIVDASRYDWDERKVRDRLLSHLHPWFMRIRPRQVFTKRPGLSLGIVSRITPIKQFDRMFATLGPVLARHPDVNLEVFGAGGFASIRDLRRHLDPLGSQVRWWGHQHAVRGIYTQLDYLLTGLPEKEALGLNVLEAQAVGTPVLAVNAPPFTETVLDGVTGHLYTDPREDDGAAFDALLTQLESAVRLDPRDAGQHLDRFTQGAFNVRAATAFGSVWQELFADV